MYARGPPLPIVCLTGPGDHIQAAAARAAIVRAVVGARQATILVADDEPSIRLLCRVNLELDGHRVVEAGTLAEARVALEEHDVDVLLIDVHLGERDGRELVRELRGRGLALPVALLTGSVALSRAERAGADELIEKPFALDELTAVVRRLAFRAAPSHE